MFDLKLLFAFFILACRTNAQSTCSGSTYSYGSSSCSSCPPGSTLISSTLGCRPSSTSAGSADTSFYLSGSQSEGVSAFSSIVSPSGITFTSDVFGTTDNAMNIASGTYISLPGSSAPSSLPSGGNVPWTVSAWVKCNPTSIPMSVIEWGSSACPLASGRYVRIIADSRMSFSSGDPHAILFGLEEVKVYSNGANVAFGKTTSSAYVYQYSGGPSGFGPSKAVDGTLDEACRQSIAHGG